MSKLTKKLRSNSDIMKDIQALKVGQQLSVDLLLWKKKTPLQIYIQSTYRKERSNRKYRTRTLNDNTLYILRLK
jgi:hypothetical protein